MEEEVGGGLKLFHHNGGAHGRQTGCHFGQALEARLVLAGVDVAVGADQNRWLDLAEAVEDAGDTEVGRGRGEHGPQQRGAEHGDKNLGGVRQPCGDSVAGSDSLLAEEGSECECLVAQLGPGERATDVVLTDECHRDSVRTSRRRRGTGKQVLGVVDGRTREERRAFHVVHVAHRWLTTIAARSIARRLRPRNRRPAWSTRCAMPPSQEGRCRVLTRSRVGRRRAASVEPDRGLEPRGGSRSPPHLAEDCQLRGRNGISKLRITGGSGNRISATDIRSVGADEPS